MVEGAVSGEPVSVVLAGNFSVIQGNYWEIPRWNREFISGFRVKICMTVSPLSLPLK